jgi:NAD(P)-dependent dehydrogenase (short-subunit alcohol dehydrogenase family)
LRAAGAPVVVTAPLDVSDASAVFAAADRFADELGPIDIWINDAMVTVFSLVRDVTPEEFRRVTEVTYLGVVYGSMAALKHMQAQLHGHIINIGSALAYRGIPLQSAYCGAKHAIRGFTASLRSELEYEYSPIRVSLLELPAMNTPQFDWARTHRTHRPKPMGAIYQPEAAAEAVIRAARTGASEYWVGTSTLLTIVGNIIAPKFMDWFLSRTAVAGQETGEPVGPDRRDNLTAPVADFHRLHGSFGADAKSQVAVFPAAATRAAIVAGGAALFFGLGLIMTPHRKARRSLPLRRASRYLRGQ